MAASLQSDVTTLLTAIRAGDDAARNKLAELIYHKLHDVASALMDREWDDDSLEPTVLLHEAFVQLLTADVLKGAPNRSYLFAAAARAMRQVLVEHARRRDTAKRGAGWRRLPLDAVLDLFEKHNRSVPALDEALEELALLNERQSQVVELRFFGGMTLPEVADQLQISVTTVESDFRKASAFLRSRLAERC
jgi:RNA polymerase sigma-70 factor, ECF subfamily